MSLLYEFLSFLLLIQILQTQCKTSTQFNSLIKTNHHHRFKKSINEKKIISTSTYILTFNDSFPCLSLHNHIHTNLLVLYSFPFFKTCVISINDSDLNSNDILLDKINLIPQLVSVVHDIHTLLSSSSLHKKTTIINPPLSTSPNQNVWHLDYLDHPPLSPFLFDYSFSPCKFYHQPTVYILDTGSNCLHSQFSHSSCINLAQFSSTEGPHITNCQSSQCLNDNNGHGTHINSLINAKNTGININIHTAAIKILNFNGEGYFSDVLAALNFIIPLAVNQKNLNSTNPIIISLSIGCSCLPSQSCSECASQCPKFFAQTADPFLQYANDHNILFTIAAGNEFCDACHLSPFNTNINYFPPNVYIVASSNMNNSLSSFSNYGKCVDIAAPGENIWGATHLNNISLLPFSGTSQSTPIVAAILAQIPSNFHNHSTTILKQLLSLNSYHIPTHHYNIISSRLFCSLHLNSNSDSPSPSLSSNPPTSTHHTATSTFIVLGLFLSFFFLFILFISFYILK